MFRMRCRVQGVDIRLAIRERDVFIPNLVGLFRATQLDVRPGDRVCDVGAGCGLHAILAAKLGARAVFGIDPNPRAIRNARENAVLNGVADRCRFFRGSLLEPMRRRGLRPDLIVSTVPNWTAGTRRRDRPAAAGGGWRRYFASGHDGMDPSVELVRQARAALAPRGRLEMHLVDWAAPERGLRALRAAGFRVRVAAQAQIPAWGRADRLLGWLRRHRLPLERRLDFAAFPRRPRSRARVVVAGRRGGRAAPPPKPPTVVVVWGRLPPERTPSDETQRHGAGRNFAKMAGRNLEPMVSGTTRRVPGAHRRRDAGGSR